MLDSVHISGVAPYGAVGSQLHGLRPINYLFGTNGTGKTTISRIIANPVTFASCRLTWRNGRPLDVLVYNRDFIDDNYRERLPGVFTLGEDSIETLEQIEQTRAAIEQAQRKIDDREVRLHGEGDNPGTYQKRRARRDTFIIDCWKIKSANDSHFSGAFEGVRGSRKLFCDKLIEQIGKTSQAELCSIEDLKTRAQTVYADTVAHLPSLPTVDAAGLLDLERAAILKKNVVGRADIAIGDLIRRLGNSDWVREGRRYAVAAGDTCPFCQKTLEADLLDDLNAFFDEAYEADIRAIERLQRAYATESDAILQVADAALNSRSPHVDVERLRPMAESLRALIELNRRHIERKLKQPSIPIVLVPLAQAVAEIEAVIGEANDAIACHNALVDNRAVERARLTSEIWRYLIEENRSDIDLFLNAVRDLDAEIEGLTSMIEHVTAERSELRRTLTALEQRQSSVQSTVLAINTVLARFGFSGFRLDTTEDGQDYRIVRDDGSEARHTLSEGERSFVTFLYFYHRISGSVTASGITNDRIVVIDDPVSSLDADVLFVVSSLIKRLRDDVIKGGTRVKQLFVLTHNVYFHKEVSFDHERQGVCRTHETFWIVRKVQGTSVLERYPCNPVSTSYELLWAEVRNPNRSILTIQNTLRRIVEHYFTLLGNMDKDCIIALFEGPDRLICASLFSWLHDGSHNFGDDLYVAPNESTVGRYLVVFEEIFKRSDHGTHYNMMMGKPIPAPLPVPAPPAA